MSVFACRARSYRPATAVCPLSEPALVGPDELLARRFLFAAFCCGALQSQFGRLYWPVTALKHRW